MNQYTQALLSILLFISLGYGARYLNLLDKDIGKRIITFLFTIPLPLLVFLSFASNTFDQNYLVLPIIAILLSLILMGISYIVGTIMKFGPKSTGTLMVAAGISSTLLFALPFISAFYGTENTKYLFLFDFGNGIIAWSLVYYLAGRIGNKHDLKLIHSLIHFLKTPMLWALVSGLIFSLTNTQMPHITKALTSQLSAFTNPLLLICVGIFLNFNFFAKKINILKLTISAIIIMGVSVLCAMAFTRLFSISGIVEKIVYICALAPAGSLSVAFSAEHDLDTEFASALVALTMTIAIIIIPLIIFLI